MKKLDKAAEDRLLGAIEKTAALVNSGVHPNDAIAKAAQEDGIPPGHLSLMVHAYNTGRTTRQRQEGGSPLDKAAEFPLADLSVVLEQVYPSQVKTAAAIEQDAAVSLEYALPPSGMLARRRQQELLKQADSIDWRRWARGEQEVVVTTPPAYPAEPAVRMKRAYCEAERLTRDVDEARRREAAAFDKLAHAFSEITDYFRRPGATPIPVVKEQAYLLHGGKASQLIDEIVRVTPGLAKMSQHKQAQVSNYLPAADGEVYGLISEFLDHVDDYRRIKHAHAELRMANQERTEALLAPFVDRPVSVLTDVGSSTEKSAAMGGLGSMLLGATAAQTLGFGGSGDKKDSGGASAGGGSRYNKLTDPAHEARLRNIRAQAMLQDMLANDPTISQHDPAEALQAYNDIVAMAPRSADQHMLMQPLLRKRLTQGSLDPFELDQLLGMEDKQRKINATTGEGDGSVLA